MGTALLVSRLLVASVFVAAALGKLADRAGFRRAVVEFGVRERRAGAVAVVLPVVEIAVAVALVPLFAVRFGAIGAGILLLGFSVAVANALAHGKAPDCHCFGQVHSAPAGWPMLGRNVVFLAIVGFVAIAGWQNAGDSATAWVARVSGPWLAVIAAALVIGAIFSFQVWFSLQLLSRNDRMLARLTALEGILQAATDARGLAQDSAGDGWLGEHISGDGLAVGARSPGFELEGVYGERHSLESLLAGNRSLMLIFSGAGCGPCEELMPRIAVWQRQYEQRLRIAVVEGGDRERSRAQAREHGLERVLLDEKREVAYDYQAYSTPSAVVIGSDALIRSPTVVGSEAITTLVAHATRPTLAAAQQAPR